MTHGLASWIERIEELPDHVESLQDWFSLSIFPEFSSETERVDALTAILAELQAMAPSLLYSELGRKLTAAHRYLNGATGPYRFAIRFYEAQTEHRLTAALDINHCRFDWIDLSEDGVIETIPFGFDVHLVDFYALLNGALQIWELTTSRSRQWYLGRDRMNSPVAFLYGYFGEQLRPDLATKMYDLIRRNDAWLLDAKMGAIA